MLLVNHALACGTPAIFVIFVVSRGSSSKALVLLVRMQIRHFRHFRQKPPFSGGTKARFTKSTVFGTPTRLSLFKGSRIGRSLRLHMARRVVETWVVRSPRLAHANMQPSVVVLDYTHTHSNLVEYDQNLCNGDCLWRVPSLCMVFCLSNF